jgi:hypothetical protein
MAEEVTVDVTQTGEVEITVNTDAATVTVGTTTTGNAGTNASVTNGGTSSAAVFNFTIPRGATGAAGPNSVTSATTSNGTATLSLSTLTVGSAATFNATTYTYGAGAASAMKTALAISSGDVNFNSAIVISGADSTLSTSGASASIFTGGENASIGTNGANAYISTSGANASISTAGANAHISTQGANATIDTQGENANIYTSGASAHIYTENATAYIQTRSTFKITDGTNTTTLSGTQTANRAIAFPDESGTSGVSAIKSANFTAANGCDYIATATLTVTDPTPSEGASFRVLVRNGTATVGPTAYSVAGTVIERVYHSGAWVNYPYSSALFGTGVATFLATPSSANLAAAVTDETGTGSLVFASSPTLTTPTIAQINTPAATNFTINPGTTGFVDITKTSAASTRESIMRAKVSDSGDDAFHIFNATVIDGSFAPGFSFSRFSSAAFCGSFVAQTTAANDTGTGAMMMFTARRTSSTTDPNNGTLSDITTRPLFGWENNATRLMTMSATGTLSLGTATPSTKAIVDLTSTTQGFLPPRMTTAQRDAITSVPAGLMIYNTTTNKLNVYTTAWEAITSA